MRQHLGPPYFPRNLHCALRAAHVCYRGNARNGKISITQGGAPEVVTGEHDLREAMADFLQEYFGLSQVRDDGADLGRVEKLAAAIDFANYMNSHMWGCKRYGAAIDLLDAGMEARRIEGLVLEFGVFSGHTINHIASRTDEAVYGFDSFEGLPEDWRPDFRQGRFQRSALPETRPNVELVVGWFDNTLPQFVATHPGPVSLLHVDCDLYSSTKTIFYYLAKRIVSGTVIVFDEYFNYVGWRHHEHKAFKEFISSAGLSYRYIGLNPRHQQVAVQII